MGSIIGIDSRIFVRDVIKKSGEKGHFESVIGIAVKVADYLKFDKSYQEAIKKAFSSINETVNYKYYCVDDINNHPKKHELLDIFAAEISKYVEKIHMFYTLFSKKRLESVKVYGRLAEKERIKLSAPTRSYEDLISQHIVQCFPAICAWRLTEYLSPGTIDFHFDSYQGHICEAQEQLEKGGFTRIIYTSGDCANPVISTADLLLDLLDKRLETQNKFLIFDNIRPALPEFGENLLVYPILNKHLPYITPLDNKPIDTFSHIKHPVFWVFKGEELIDSGTVKRSQSFRNLIDYAASKYGVVKMFDKGKDIEQFHEGDYGVYLNTRGKEIIDSYVKIGKKFKYFKLDYMISQSLKP
jgi:hypothetical protein